MMEWHVQKDEMTERGNTICPSHGGAEKSCLTGEITSVSNYRALNVLYLFTDYNLFNNVSVG